MTPLDEIKRLYFNATKTTIQKDLARAIDLLKSLGTETERQKAAVYMDGLSQMRSEWAAARGPIAKNNPRKGENNPGGRFR
jgi:hypothetical protein